MTLKQRLEQDLKTALLARDSQRVSVLRSLKSAITYAEVAKGVKGGQGLDDQAISGVLAKEAKKRQESADAYRKVGESERAEAELHEKSLINEYLPEAPGKEVLEQYINGAIAQVGELTTQTMGRVIGQVKQHAGAGADGALIADLVKERLNR